MRSSPRYARSFPKRHHQRGSGSSWRTSSPFRTGDHRTWCSRSEMCCYDRHGGLFRHWQIPVLSCGNNVLASVFLGFCRVLDGRGERWRAACLLLVACRTGIIVHMDTGSLPSRWDSYARRLPSSLEDLRGPPAGVIELPMHVAWSGRRVYDVGREDQRLVLYALLL